MSVKVTTHYIKVPIRCCVNSCGTCQFKLIGDNQCQIYGFLEPSKMGSPGSSKRHQKCIDSDVTANKIVAEGLPK